MTKVIRFKGLCCANCAQKLEAKINKIKGVQATMSFVAGKIMLELANEDLLEEVILCCKREFPDMTITL